MSTGGQVIGGVVGAVAGYLLPGSNVFLGASIGMALGGAIDPPKGPTVSGPRLSDLTMQTNAYGAVIPRCYGTISVTGNILWIENNALKETITRNKSGGSGGKGGGGKKSATTSVSYSYSATFAVGLCQGPITGVRRIWISGNLIYDAGSSDPATITASNAAATGFAIYLGTDAQSPDARMQATLGVANTPAFRGLAYIVFYDFQLAKYGNSLSGAQVKVEVVQAASITLDSVVSAECLLGLPLVSGDIDVSALSGNVVRGYRIASAAAIRGFIEPLQTAWPFDVRQHGYQIQFVFRGGASVVTIPASDLDARESSQNPGVQITTNREVDAQMPQRVAIQYIDLDREYDIGGQYAERMTTNTANLLTKDLPIVLTATEAAGKAEVLLYLMWLERFDLSFALPPTYNHLEPGDVVTLTTPEGPVLLRLTEINYTSDGRVECKAKFSSSAVYTPTAIGATPAVTGPTTIIPVGPSSYDLLDLPMILSLQSGGCFVAAMRGTLTGWEGGSLFSSTDAGASWIDLYDVVAPGSTMGVASNSLSSVDHRSVDSGSLLSVTLSNGALSSVTRAQMLAGANHLAYGADGRWEIIAAQTCTWVSGTSYVLSNLLRGRYGTEWAMGLHASGDALILLDADEVALIVSSTAAIGQPRLYRGITFDQDISTDGNRTFTYQGVNFKPYAPIYLTGAVDPSSNDWSLSWLARTRIVSGWRDYVYAESGESIEQYVVEIFADGTYAVLKRVLTVSTRAATYVSADQVSDFGANQSTLYLKIYQLSATVGRGYPLTTSLVR
jgi:hypothetical protein